MTTAAHHYVCSKSGADQGVYPGATPAEALAAHHRDAGYEVSVDASGDLVFTDAEDAALCGGLTDWHIHPATPALAELSESGADVAKWVEITDAGLATVREHCECGEANSAISGVGEQCDETRGPWVVVETFPACDRQSHVEWRGNVGAWPTGD